MWRYGDKYKSPRIMIFTRKFDFNHWQYKLSVVFLDVIDSVHSFLGGKCVKNQFFSCLLVKILCHKTVWTVHSSVTPVFFLKAIIVFWYAPEVLFDYFSFLYTEYWHLLNGSDLLKLITQFHHGHSKVKLSIYLIWCHCLDWHQGTSTLPTIVFVPSVQIQHSNKFRYHLSMKIVLIFLTI